MREFCQVVYLPRTEGISSTQLREEFQEEIKIGIIGIDVLPNVLYRKLQMWAEQELWLFITHFMMRR